jgi:ribosomal protein L28
MSHEMTGSGTGFGRFVKVDLRKTRRRWFSHVRLADPILPPDDCLTGDKGGIIAC